MWETQRSEEIFSFQLHFETKGMELPWLKKETSEETSDFFRSKWLLWVQCRVWPPPDHSPDSPVVTDVAMLSRWRRALRSLHRQYDSTHIRDSWEVHQSSFRFLTFLRSDLISSFRDVDRCPSFDLSPMIPFQQKHAVMACHGSHCLDNWIMTSMTSRMTSRGFMPHQREEQGRQRPKRPKSKLLSCAKTPRFRHSAQQTKYCTSSGFWKSLNVTFEPFVI